MNIKFKLLVFMGFLAFINKSYASDDINCGGSCKKSIFVSIGTSDVSGRYNIQKLSESYIPGMRNTLSRYFPNNNVFVSVYRFKGDLNFDFLEKGSIGINVSIDEYMCGNNGVGISVLVSAHKKIIRKSYSCEVSDFDACYQKKLDDVSKIILDMTKDK